MPAVVFYLPDKYKDGTWLPGKSNDQPCKWGEIQKNTEREDDGLGRELKLVTILLHGQFDFQYLQSMRKQNQTTVSPTMLEITFIFVIVHNLK